MAEHVYKGNDTWSVEQGSIAPQLDYNRKPKYIVKNCPSILPMTKLCDSESIFNCGTFCKDCTDCLIKRVIEKCREQSYFVKRFPMFEYSDGVINSKLAQDILDMFDIQEVKE